MGTMKSIQSLKPSKIKIVVALLPFIFPLVQLIAGADIKYQFIPVELDYFAALIFLILASETFIARPLEGPLRLVDGFWSQGSLSPFPSGPLLPGSFAVAIVYSLLVYVLWSLISLVRRK